MTEPSASAVTSIPLAESQETDHPTQLPKPQGAKVSKASLFGGIGRRLLVNILIFSSFVTLALTAFQLYTDYQRDVGAIERRVEQIRSSYHDSLARSLWRVDMPQLQAQLEGIVRLPDIRSATVQESKEKSQQPLSVAVGKHQDNAALVWHVPLVFDDHGRSSTIGTLTIEGTLDDVYDRLANRALIILATQGVKTFFVSLFILYIVHALVTRHLVLLARLIRRVDLRTPMHSTLLVQRRKVDGPDDELDQLFEAFHSMQGKLEDAYTQLRQTNAKLELDIAARISAEAQATHLAYHEALTGLANRRMLKERLAHEAPLSERLNRHGALLFVDLDHFQRFNDALGHAAGDGILLETGHRLSAVRSTDLLASLGGDEFVVLLTGLGETAKEAAHAAHQVANSVRAALAAPYAIGEQSLHLTVSIGVTLFPADGNDAEMLLKNVDTAVHHAKMEGGNCIHFFQPEMQASAHARHQMETDLRMALLKQQFSLAFQPQVDRAGRLLSAEALIRWRHPARGWVSPAEFIPMAEESTLILEIGAWVMTHAIEQLRQWGSAGLLKPGFSLAINVSPRQFQQADFVQSVQHALRGLANPRQVTLEITEGMLVVDTDHAVERMRVLRDLGVQFHIDDFGTGYSSMAYLKRLPVDVIKIDQSFVRDMVENPADTAIVKAMLAVASSFNLEVIAEGVETEEQVNRLWDMGCHIYQGYYFSRPITAEEFATGYLGR